MKRLNLYYFFQKLIISKAVIIQRRAVTKDPYFLGLTLLTLGLLALTSCSDKTTPDDWQGVKTNLDIENPARVFPGSFPDDKFTLVSYLKLPQLDAQSSFEIDVICKRNDNKKTYSKLSKFPSLNTLKKIAKKAVENNQIANTEPKEELELPKVKQLEKIKVPDILPEVVLIYPEKFDSCDFKYMATNEIGSTDKERMAEIKLIYDPKYLEIKFRLDQNLNDLNDLVSKPKVEYNFTKPLNTEDLSQVSFSHYIDKEPLNNVTVICYDKKVIRKKLGLKSINEVSAIYLRTPDPDPKLPARHCIAIAKDSLGETVQSGRITILNENFKKTLKAYTSKDKINEMLSGPRRIKYNTFPGKEYLLYELNIRNESDSVVDLELTKGAIIKDNIHAIIGLKEISVDRSPTYTVFKYQALTRSKTVDLNWDLESSRIKLVPRSNITLRLILEPNFSCNWSKKESFKELGFIYNLSYESTFFDIKQTSTNEFMTDIIYKGNLFERFQDLRKIDYKLPVEYGKFSNKPGFNFLFVNTSTYKKDVSPFIYKQKECIFQTNGEPSPNCFKDGIFEYSSYVSSNSVIQCFDR